MKAVIPNPVRNTKIKVFGIALLAILLCQKPFAVQGQGTFQNFGFEEPMTPLMPEPPYGFVPMLDALPDWTGYLGTNQQTRVLFNNMFVGTATLGLLGPEWQGGTISGNYTALLQTGVDPLDPRSIVNASIGQTGLVPMAAKSLQFQMRGNAFVLQFNGHVLPVVSISNGPNYVLFGADVTSFAGQIGELRFTAISEPTRLFNNVFLDAFAFSNQPIPEPRTISLFIFGSLLIGWRLFCPRR